MSDNLYSNWVMTMINDIKVINLFIDVESNLPPNLRDEAVLCFEAAVANRRNIGDAIKKVEDDVLTKCNAEFQGKRFKGFIKFNYDTNMIQINVSSEYYMS